MKHHLSLRKLSIIAGIACALIISFAAVAPEASAHDQGRVYFSNFRQAKNHQDNRIVVKGNVQLNRPGERTATMSDTALAYSSCEGCSTFVVALQLNLISPEAVSSDTFNTTAVAKNYKCTGCTTEAIAVQMDVITDNYRYVPASVYWTIARLNAELAFLSPHPHMSLSDVEQRINNIVHEFESIRIPDPPGRAAATMLPRLRVQWFRTTDFN